MELFLATYHLRFKQPFGTAHGLRLGTDSVFVRLGRKGQWGYGEATLPPYVNETQASVVQWLGQISMDKVATYMERVKDGGDPTALLEGPPAARAALTEACIDLLAKEMNTSASSLLQMHSVPFARGRAMVTLGHTPPDKLEFSIPELDGSFPIVKLKAGGTDDLLTARTFANRDPRQVLIDANQGWTSIQQALDMVAELGQDRIVAFEQPFGADDLLRHQELKAKGQVVIADESIRTLKDLSVCSNAFSGSNIKLMKCGGPDRAVALIREARACGMMIMLGCMSESSLGCGVMANLAPWADLVDLDGPWLLANDPFDGVVLRDGRVRTTGQAGWGVSQSSAAELNWIHIGA